jgi:hypothetical protein
MKRPRRRTDYIEFLSPKALSCVRFEQEVYNSRVKRGAISTEGVVRTEMIVCGCGIEGCCFIRALRADDLAAIHSNLSSP